MRACQPTTNLIAGSDQVNLSRMEVVALREDVDLRFHDRVALEEIELYSEVLSAVAASDRALTPAEIDEVLGLRRSATAKACAH
jgi:hypothetical protein